MRVVNGQAAYHHRGQVVHHGAKRHCRAKQCIPADSQPLGLSDYQGQSSQKNQHPDQHVSSNKISKSTIGNNREVAGFHCSTELCSSVNFSNTCVL